VSAFILAANIAEFRQRLMKGMKIMLEKNMAANESEIANLKMDLQLFAEGDPVDPAPADPTPADPTPAPEPTPSPTPDPEPIKEPTETQAFSKRLNDMTQKAIDAEYSRLYGAEYGIHTKADYDAAIAKQEAEAQRQQFKEENGIDPEALKPVFEQMLKSDPRYQRLEQQEREMNITAAVSNFDKEFPELGVKSFDDIAKLPNIDKVYEYVNGKGLSLNDAYKLANYGDVVTKTAQTAQQEAIKKIAANGASSPGSLSNVAEETLLTEEAIEKMTDKERMANWKQIKRTYNMK
jgi:hypothetical protein